MNIRNGIIFSAVAATALSISITADAHDNKQKYTVENSVKVYRGGPSPAEHRANSQRLQAIVNANIEREKIAVRKAEIIAKARTDKQASYERGYAKGKQEQCRATRQQSPYRRHRYNRRHYPFRTAFSPYYGYGSGYGNNNRRTITTLRRY